MRVIHRSKHYGLLRRGRELKIVSVLLVVSLTSYLLSYHSRARSPPRELFSGIQHSVYINRDSRSDRRSSIERQLQAAGINALRVSAVEVYGDSELLRRCWDGGSKKCAGQLGCQRSHVKAISLAIEQKWSHVAVFEDDFVWQNHTDATQVHRIILEVDEIVPHWDVIVLSLNVKKARVLKNKYVNIGYGNFAEVVKVEKALATHGFIARSSIFMDLLHAFERCKVQSNLKTAIDTCWQTLQKRYNWYGLQPQLATQGVSFSDIEGRLVSYAIEYGIT
jgi:GR25 family glycosyltransferase involved in LPS biosynthesis